MTSIYPPRECEKEKKDMHLVATAHRDMINHYAYGGIEEFVDFSALIIGHREIGDDTLTLAESCRDTNAVIIHADKDKNYLKQLQQRASVRKLDNIQFILLENDLTPLRDQRFDFIASSTLAALSGNYDQGVKVLRSYLKEHGVLSLSVAGSYASNTLNAVRALVKPLLANSKSQEQQIIRVKEFLEVGKEIPSVASLLKSHAYHLNNDAGIYHKLISNELQHASLSCLEIYQLAATHGFKGVCFFGNDLVHGHLGYRPELYIKDNAMRASLKQALPYQRTHMAEILNGHMFRHHFYLALESLPVATPDDTGNIPFIFTINGQKNDLEILLSMVEQSQNQQCVVQKRGGKISLTFPKYSYELLRHINGNRSIAEIISLAEQDIHTSPKPTKQQLGLIFQNLFTLLHNHNWLLLAKPWVKRSRPLHQIKQDVAKHYDLEPDQPQLTSPNPNIAAPQKDTTVEDFLNSENFSW